jgi:hypothetical protein
MESLVYRLGQLLDTPHLKIVFGAGSGNPHDIGFLKSVRSDEGRGNLPGEDNYGNGVEIGVGNARNGIRRARPGSHEDDTDLSGNPGISVRRMYGALLVSDEDMGDVTPV